MSESTQMLARAIYQQADKQGLILIDENTRIKELSPKTNLAVITNRYDLDFSLKKKEFQNVEFSDFDLSAIPDTSLDFVAHRVGKDKATTHYIINQAFRVLKKGGVLLLSGVRKEGTKTYGEKAALLFASTPESITTKSGSRLITLSKVSETAGEPLDDKKYGELRTVALSADLSMSSKPGVFGWEKVDQGSKFLVENLPSFEGQTVADLGCGYGYLSFHAKRLGAAKVLATDNNAAAIKACSQNFADLEINGSVIASNAAKDWEKGCVEAVVCNPPFHQGTKQNANLAEVFSRSMRKILPKTGAAYVVVSAFIPFEKSAKSHFETVEELANNKQFKVLKLS